MMLPIADAEIGPQLRLRTCHETLELVRPYFEQAGITRVADVTGLDFPRLPVFVAVRPNARSLSTAQGKGTSRAAARTSAVMEALEHYHAENAEVSLRLSSLETLGGEACQVERLPRVSPWPLHPDTRLLWTRAALLGTTESRWVPFEMVHLDLVIPLPTASGCFPVSSNGLASGNTLAEASVHALYELIERDAWTSFREHSPAHRSARRIEITSITDELVRATVQQLKESGLVVALWDISSDVGVSCVLCALVDAAPNPYRPVSLAYGCGCHTERQLAALRALTEAAQGRVTNIVGTRDDTAPRDLSELRSDARVDAARLTLLNERCEHSWLDVPQRPFAGYDAELEALRVRLKECGMHQVLRVDLSRKGWPIAVARLLVPGLEGFHDVPSLQLGSRGAAAQAKGRAAMPPRRVP